MSNCWNIKLEQKLMERIKSLDSELEYLCWINPTFCTTHLLFTCWAMVLPAISLAFIDERNCGIVLLHQYIYSEEFSFFIKTCKKKWKHYFVPIVLYIIVDGNLKKLATKIGCSNQLKEKNIRTDEMRSYK